MRVVADTNVLISALMFGGLPGTFLNLALAGGFTLLSSGPLLDELDEKLQGKFAVPQEKARAIQVLLRKTALVVQPDIALHIITDDPDDNRVLECAVAGGADFIVSGDRHLLRIGSQNEISILNVRQFFETTGFRAE